MAKHWRQIEALAKRAAVQLGYAEQHCSLKQLGEVGEDRVAGKKVSIAVVVQDVPRG